MIDRINEVRDGKHVQSNEVFVAVKKREGALSNDEAWEAMQAVLGYILGEDYPADYEEDVKRIMRNLMGRERTRFFNPGEGVDAGRLMVREMEEAGFTEVQENKLIVPALLFREVFKGNAPMLPVPRRMAKR